MSEFSIGVSLILGGLMIALAYMAGYLHGGGGR